MILEMRNICKDYPMGKTVTRVLRDVSLDVAEGEYLAIMGPSGSGKTTLMNIIGCLDEPTSGSYLLCGQDITACTDLQLAQVRKSHRRMPPLRHTRPAAGQTERRAEAS